MSDRKKILNVLYQSDDNYAMISGTSIVSLLENNKHLDEVNIYYCEYKISKENITKLKKIANQYQNATMRFIDAVPYHQIFLDLGVKSWHGVYITWLKMLAFGDLSINTDRILFINGHTIINGSLEELIHLDFEGNVMALAYDGLVNEHKKTIGLAEDDGYYNCGIMLINHKKWKAEKIASYVKSQLQQKSDYVIADQDLCNVIFHNKIKLLNSTYNYSSAYHAYNLQKFLKLNHLRPPYFYSYEELMENYYSPKIIHSLFGVQGKPWEEGSKHPQKYLWQKYIDMTPWKNTKRPIAKRSLTWRLYEILPSALFMSLYIVAVRKKFS